MICVVDRMQNLYILHSFCIFARKMYRERSYLTFLMMVLLIVAIVGDGAFFFIII